MLPKHYKSINLNICMSITNKSKTLEVVQGQYQEYPYPFRNPEDEKTRLLSIQGEFLGELNHNLYKGKMDFKNNFHVLIAGGGTGDSSIFLAEQLKNTNAEIIYLDFSKPSMEIAQKRAEIRGLTNIKWINDSILNIPNLNLGKFDYINCSGVIHHLESPPEGLKILQQALKPTGGMAIMVYAKYGRTAIYQIQDLMKMVNTVATNRVEEVMNAKTILNSLPPTNWQQRGAELATDHINFGDVGIYDLFLHKQDRCYSVPEIYEFVENADLNFVEFYDPCEKLALRPETYIKDFSLLQKIKAMDLIKQRAICEIIVGNIIKHTFYASNQKDSVAVLEDLNNTPYFYAIAGLPQQVYDYLTSSAAVGNMNSTLNSTWLKDISLNIPISAYTKHIFKLLVGESKTLREIFDAINAELEQKVDDKILLTEVSTAFEPFITVGAMLLRDKNSELPT